MQLCRRPCSATVRAQRLHDRSLEWGTQGGGRFSDNCPAPTFGPSGVTACSASGVTVDASGKYLYMFDAMNSISGFAIDGQSGALALLPGSPFAASPYPYLATAYVSYLYVSNNGAGGSISTYSVDRATGSLAQNANSPVTASPPGGGAYNLTLVP